MENLDLLQQGKDNEAEVFVSNTTPQRNDLDMDLKMLTKSRREKEQFNEMK